MIFVELMKNGNNFPAHTLNLGFSDEKQKVSKIVAYLYAL